MTPAIVLAAAVLASALILVYANRPRTLERRARRQVVVTKKNGTSFQGVLHDSDRLTVVLCTATVVPDGTPIDGELVLERADVEMIQFP